MYVQSLQELINSTRAYHCISLNTGEVFKKRGVDKMNADEYYGEYLKAEDVKQDISVTTEEVNLETIDGEQKVVLQLLGFKKRFVLNKTNKDRLKALFGTSETDEWLKKEFTLTKEQVDYKGKQVPALRVKTKEAV